MAELIGGRLLTVLDGNPPEALQKALAIIPKVTSSFSIFGSGFIIYDVLYARPRRTSDKRTTYHRVILGLSCCDFLVSCSLAMSNWALPAELQEVQEAAWNPMGNHATCTAQGFFSQIGLATSLYNAMLALYYVLTIRRGVSASTMAKKYEIWLHIIPITIALATMIACLALGLFNFGLWDCWISSSPWGCTESWDATADKPASCTKGDNALLYGWAFYYAPTWLCMLWVTVCMFRIHRSVLAKEQATDKYNVDGTRRRDNSKRIAQQGYAYVGAYMLSIVPATAAKIHQTITGEAHYEWFIVIALTLPLQGFWNMLVYLRPRYLQHRSKKLKQLQSAQSATAYAGTDHHSKVETSFRQAGLIEDPSNLGPSPTPFRLSNASIPNGHPQTDEYTSNKDIIEEEKDASDDKEQRPTSIRPTTRWWESRDPNAAPRWWENSDVTVEGGHLDASKVSSEAVEIMPALSDDDDDDHSIKEVPNELDVDSYEEEQATNAASTTSRAVRASALQTVVEVKKGTGCYDFEVEC